MPRPTLVLDANSLSDRRFVGWLRQYPGRKILPIVAYVEVGVLFASNGRLDEFRSLLAGANIELEWMRQAEADAAIASGAAIGDFSENARDHLIAAHAGRQDRVLVTRNLRDFSHVTSARTPEQAMQDLG